MNTNIIRHTHAFGSMAICSVTRVYRIIPLLVSSHSKHTHTHTYDVKLVQLVSTIKLHMKQSCLVCGKEKVTGFPSQCGILSVSIALPSFSTAYIPHNPFGK